MDLLRRHWSNYSTYRLGHFAPLNNRDNVNSHSEKPYRKAATTHITDWFIVGEWRKQKK